MSQCLSGSNSDALAHWDICQAVIAHGLELAYTHPLGTCIVLACSGLCSTELTGPHFFFLNELTAIRAKSFDHFRIKTCHYENILHLSSVQREMN